jgi:hypothetical protein
MKHWHCRFVCVNANSEALECTAERARSGCLRDALPVGGRESGGSARRMRRHGLCSHAHALPPAKWGADGWAGEWAMQREWTAGTMRTPTHAHSSDTTGVGGVSAAMRRSGVHAQSLIHGAATAHRIAECSLRTMVTATWAPQCRCQWMGCGRECSPPAAGCDAAPRCRRHAHRTAAAGTGARRE